MRDRDAAVGDAATEGDAGRSDAGVDAGSVDGGNVDSGPDASITRGGPTTTHQTAGGGRASGPRHTLRFSVGAPQPMGSASGSGTTLTTGPAASGR